MALTIDILEEVCFTSIFILVVSHAQLVSKQSINNTQISMIYFSLAIHMKNAVKSRASSFILPCNHINK